MFSRVILVVFLGVLGCVLGCILNVCHSCLVFSTFHMFEGDFLGLLF